MAKHKPEKIVIDEPKGLVFRSESELLNHFKKDIDDLEKFYVTKKRESDFSDKDAESMCKLLDTTLESPDEIWVNHNLIDGLTPNVYIKVFEGESQTDDFYYVAVTYNTEKIPSFIYLHFPSNDLGLVEKFRSGELQYSRHQLEVPEGAIDGDALYEGDELATGLYEAMLLLRSSHDIGESQFPDFAELREGTIEGAEEIWRKPDSLGNVLVHFIREFPDDEVENLHYVVVTVEEPGTNSHALLLSFPTTDNSLLERYRQGENLQAEEVVQESSH